MAVGSTERFYVPIEVSKILKKRGYTPDYDGMHDIPVIEDGISIEDGVVIYKSDPRFKELEDILLPMVPWQEAFRFIRERFGIYAYIKRDTYWHKYRYAFERDQPRGGTTSAVYDTIDEARVALFKRIDEEEIPKMFENPSYYDLHFDLTEEDIEEGKKWRETIDEYYKKVREEAKKKVEKPEL